MAKIPLRTYLQEIERLVDSQRIDEAVAHSRHILQSYPKYVDVYRVLGKAYLEAKRYGDAADIFQRVLSSLPEDFVSNAGMSIIREDEGNLDEAIWHMERAFEIEPSNSSVQDELRRLIGKRDGLEPPRIRLTRGALARMYMKGDLIPEAINEIRIALTEDPNRLDLKALLAVALHRVGQRVEAIDTANQVLQKLPNNLDANRIMAELLAGTERDMEAQEYRKVIVELEPYFNFVTPSTPIASQVPSQAVGIEKLDWKPAEVQPEVIEAPSWAAIPEVQPAEPGEAEEAVPEWLSTHQEVFGPADVSAEQEAISVPTMSEDQESQEVPLETAPQPEEISAEPQEEIPDWMLAAGWIPIAAAAAAQEETQELPVETQSEPAEEALELAAPVWLAENQPVPETPTEPVMAGEGSEEALPEWVFEKETAISADNELPPWLSEEAEEQPAAALSEGNSQPGSTEGLPDWLFVEETPAAEKQEAEAEIPAWLMEDASATASSPELEPADEEPAEVPMPAWLLESASPAESSQADEPEIFPAEAAAVTGAVVVKQTLEAPTQQDSGIPAPSEPVPPTTIPASVETATPAEASPAPEAPQTKPATTLKLPAWLLVSKEIDHAAAASEEAVSEGATSPVLEEALPVEDRSEQNEISSPTVQEDYPAWLLDEDVQIQELPAQGNSSAAETPSSEEEIPDWMAMLAEPALTEEDTKPTKVEKAAEFTALSGSLPSEESIETPAEGEALPPAWLLAALAEHEKEPAQPQPVMESPGGEAEEPENQPLSEPLAGNIPEWLLLEEIQSQSEDQEPETVKLETNLEAAAQPGSPGATADEVINEYMPGAGLDESTEATPEAVLRAEIMAQEILDEPEGAEEPLDMPEEFEGEIEAGIPSEEMPEWLITPVEDKSPIFGWTPPPVAPSETVNLNTASLVDIEKLPGIGFIRAQNIINYREHNGLFMDLDELEKVPGITSDIKDNLKNYVYIEKVETGEPAEEEPVEEPVAKGVIPLELLNARSALVQDQVDPALVEYTKFIESYQFLPEIILDLKEAVSRHPDNPDLWLSLGDAYIRSNQVQSALEAYRQAEKLLI